MATRVTDTDDSPGAAAPGGPSRAGVPDDLSELRALILGGAHERRIAALSARLNDPAVMAQVIGPILPDAIARRGHDLQLARALEPSIAHAITSSVRRNPKPLADALFPVIGPAIRSAIAHALGSLLETTNRTLEQKLSWRALRWRLESWRTGRPFAEIVLLHTLEYRVEQVFLIHRETGLLLGHVASPSSGAQGADMVSAMLTAIRDFARDSFGAGADETLNKFEIGPLSVLVVQGPHAVIAGVVRGTPPPGLRVTLQDALETIHLHFATDLAAFAGDSRAFGAARPILEACAVAQYREVTSRRRMAWGWVAALAALVAVAALWFALSWRDARRWDAYLTRVRSEPGLVVLDADRRGRTFVVTGLRDPLAPDPSSFLAAAGVPADRVEARWQAFQALDPAFVLARAVAVLRPPPGVTLRVDQGVLSADGDVTPAWVFEATRLAPMIAGVHAIDPALASMAARALRVRLDATSVTFVRGRADVAPGQEAALARAVDLFRELEAAARAAGAPIAVRVVGHADADGAPELNQPLSHARARTMRAHLDAIGLTGVRLLTDGVGSAQPLTAGLSEDEKARNRRVSFAVVEGLGVPAGSGR